MTVSELIENLNKMPHDSLVVVRGYESGLDDVSNVVECKIRKPKNPTHYEGLYAISENGDIEAVYIKEIDGYNRD